MGKNSKIEWTDHTWNPFIGCTKVSDGCKNCYMFRAQTRFGYDPTHVRRTSRATFNLPLKIAEPSKIFVCSWSDFFHPDIDPLAQKEAIDIMEYVRRHTYMILTKRPENIFIPYQWWQNNPHVWLGVTVENKATRWRFDMIRNVPARVKFISAEPLLEPIDIEPFVTDLDWIIVGGESGAHHRYFGADWARAIRDTCQFYQIPFFMKQMSGGTKEKRSQIPPDLLIREFPKGA